MVSTDYHLIVKNSTTSGLWNTLLLLFIFNDPLKVLSAIICVGGIITRQTNIQLRTSTPTNSDLFISVIALQANNVWRIHENKQIMPYIWAVKE